MNGFDRITIDPQQMAGFPCIRHLHIPVATIVELVRSGKTEAQILAQYPALQREDIRQAMAYVAARWACESHFVN